MHKIHNNTWDNKSPFAHCHSLKISGKLASKLDLFRELSFVCRNIQTISVKKFTVLFGF